VYSAPTGCGPTGSAALAAPRAVPWAGVAHQQAGSGTGGFPERGEEHADRVQARHRGIRSR
jgi:hypothetical protein